MGHLYLEATQNFQTNFWEPPYIAKDLLIPISFLEYKMAPKSWFGNFKWLSGLVVECQPAVLVPTDWGDQEFSKLTFISRKSVLAGEGLVLSVLY